jgi:hypothetical protein
MDRAVVKNEDDGFTRAAGAWPIDRIEAAQEGDEVAAALGGAGADDQLVGGNIERPDHRSLLRLSRRLNAQVAVAFGPGPSEIGVGQSLRLVAEQQRDIAGFGLLVQQAKTQAGAVDGMASCRPLSVWRRRGPSAHGLVPRGQAKPPYMRRCVSTTLHLRFGLTARRLN